MSFIADIIGGGNVIKAVGDTIDNLFTTDEERLEKQMEIMKAQREYDYLEAKLISEQNIAQTEVNKEEAKSSNLFIAGWRPAIGWIGAAALLYQYLLYPLLLWLPIKEKPPAPLDYTMLFTLITGMLGIAGLRSFDKLKGTDTQRIAARK